MSAIAGRILILPKGEYDATLTYEFLDLVNHNGRSWLAKKSSTGVEPTDANSEYWQPFGASIIPDGLTVEINADGEISVIDSPKLGGKDASEYALVSGTVLYTSILEYALTVPNGKHFIRLAGNEHDGTDLPHANYRYGSAEIERRSASNIAVALWGIAFDYPLTVNYYNNGVWSGWKGFSDFLPLSGGTVGQVICKTGGGTTPFKVERTDSDRPLVEFVGQSGSLGHFGFDGADKPIIRKTDGTLKELLHTGNKPSGTYTGNGDATERIIETGGIGTVCHITTQGYTLLATARGSFGVQAVTGAEPIALLPNQIMFFNGQIILRDSNPYINASGATYTYQVL